VCIALKYYLGQALAPALFWQKHQSCSGYKSISLCKAFGGCIIVLLGQGDIGFTHTALLQSHATIMAVVAGMMVAIPQL